MNKLEEVTHQVLEANETTEAIQKIADPKTIEEPIIEVKDPEFVPQLIGTDYERLNQIHALFEELTAVLSGHKWDVENILSKEMQIELDEFLDFLKIDKSELPVYLRRKHVENNEINLPGINTEKLINSDLLDLPSDYESVVGARQFITDLVEKILETRFSYPVSKLFENGKFDLNEEFEQELFRFCSCWTESEKQNRALQLVNDFCSSTNNLIDFGLVHSRGNMWVEVGKVLIYAVINTKSQTSPLQPNMKMFNQFPMNRYRIAGFRGNQYPSSKDVFC